MVYKIIFYIILHRYCCYEKSQTSKIENTISSLENFKFLSLLGHKFRFLLNKLKRDEELKNEANKNENQKIADEDTKTSNGDKTNEITETEKNNADETISKEASTYHLDKNCLQTELSSDTAS